MDIYEKQLAYLKAMADTNRLKILDMLSCGDMCACDLLEKLTVTQPTLSHHMKILLASQLVTYRKDGKWTWYSLNKENADWLEASLHQLLRAGESCVCN